MNQTPGKAYVGLRVVDANAPSPKSPEPDSCSHLVDTLSSDLDELGAAISSLECRLDWVLNPRSDLKAPEPASPLYDGIMRQKLQGVRDNITSKKNWINEITQRINL